MSEIFKDGEELDDSEAAIFMVLFGLLAYMYENKEPIIVKEETVLALMKKAFDTGNFPYPSFRNNGDGYIRFGSKVDVNEDEED